LDLIFSKVLISDSINEYFFIYANKIAFFGFAFSLTGDACDEGCFY
jgi:hypothetical protein